jgi:hypothetical protein
LFPNIQGKVQYTTTEILSIVGDSFSQDDIEYALPILLKPSKQLTDTHVTEFMITEQYISFPIKDSAVYIFSTKDREVYK